MDSTAPLRANGNYNNHHNIYHGIVYRQFVATLAPLLSTFDGHGFLEPNDGVDTLLWFISFTLAAATDFFFFGAMNVAAHRLSSLHVGLPVTLTTGVYYFYMHEYWATFMQPPVAFRYIVWSLAVPLQMVGFYFIL